MRSKRRWPTWRPSGVQIATIGQYLRPTERHLPVARFWEPEEFDDLAERGRRLGLAHVQASPAHALELSRARSPQRGDARRRAVDSSLTRIGLSGADIH